MVQMKKTKVETFKVELIFFSSYVLSKKGDEIVKTLLCFKGMKTLIIRGMDQYYEIISGDLVVNHKAHGHFFRKIRI